MWRDYWNKPKEGFPSKAQQLEEEEWKRKGKLEDEKFIVSHIPNSEILIDVGCGTARFYPHLKDKITKYIGCDYSESMLELAKKKYDVETRQCDAEQLPFPSSFGTVICIDVLRHLPTEKAHKVIKELLRVGKTVLFNITVSEKPCIYGDKHSYIPNAIVDHPFTLAEITELLDGREYRIMKMPPQSPYREWNRLLFIVEESTGK